MKRIEKNNWRLRVVVLLVIMFLGCARLGLPTQDEVTVVPPLSLPTKPAETAALIPSVTQPTPTLTISGIQITPADQTGLAGTGGTPPPMTSQLVQPADLQYLGAFRLPKGSERPLTFEYGGSAMTFNPTGDANGVRDGFPGTLFITGHDRLAYGELPDGSQVAEINIPAPRKVRDLGGLDRAGFIQPFQNVAKGFFTGLDEIPRIGLQYLDTPATGPKLHIAWGQHLQPDTPLPSHAWFETNLADPKMTGTWFIGNQPSYSVNGYMFEIPGFWADLYTGGRYLATGRFRDGGWAGMGLALFAYRPWVDEKGTPAASGTHLEEAVLLQYESSRENNKIERCLDNYQHPDEWEGGAWISTRSGKTALLFAGTKSNGIKYWYGYLNPAGAEKPCVDVDMVSQFETCRLADGTVCPQQDLAGCQGHNDYRGWWSTHFDAQFILYNPAQMAQVAAGKMPSWQPQPYAMQDIDEVLYLNPTGIEEGMIGKGDQRRYRIGPVAYDRESGLLYVLELFADGAMPVVHVWRIE